MGVELAGRANRGMSCSVLRAIVPDKEYRDTVAQLPKEHSAILPG
ncbi:hypothetical protein ACFFX1_17575 [Dactylosporangium sucinum]|uniref:Uncharacterized protein n=1 Tax=Dactylosporangium sucinum TaxID=1424081 RepID=A0A917UAE0_9ACTN|nr:hypothetical protein [Dactylosporangium sucinum]GGM72866.1 hypothetical protein GCM10007977_088170 [Dactylosporangium sucinum]